VPIYASTAYTAAPRAPETRLHAGVPHGQNGVAGGSDARDVQPAAVHQHADQGAPGGSAARTAAASCVWLPGRSAETRSRPCATKGGRWLIRLLAFAIELGAPPLPLSPHLPPLRTRGCHHPCRRRCRDPTRGRGKGLCTSSHAGPTLPSAIVERTHLQHRKVRATRRRSLPRSRSCSGTPCRGTRARRRGWQRAGQGINRGSSERHRCGEGSGE